MSKSNAELQAAYRQRHLKSLDSTSERLNMVIDLHAKRALERLARHQGLTQRAVLEKLLMDADRLTADRLVVLPGGCSEYYDGKAKSRV